MARTNYTIGEVTHASEYDELIPDLLDELTRRAKGTHGETARAHRELVRDIRKRIAREYPDHETRDYYDTNAVQDDIDALVEALDYYSAPYFRFSDYDGAYTHYGYWLDSGALEDFDGLKVADTADVPREYRGEVLHVNDHGNMTLYVAKRGKLVEVWAVV